MAPKTKVLLLASFCLNAVLAAAWIANRSATPVPSKTEATTVNAADQGRSKKTLGNRAVETITVNHEKALDWTSVESADYREYIANLRAIGCPEETVRDIIIADINKLYASKMAALYPSSKDIKFWKVEDRLARNEERERDKKRRELEQEKRTLIKELLGVDYDSEMARWSGRPNDDDTRYGFLSPVKQEQTKALREKYREMERSLFTDGGGMTPENRAKFTALRAERETEMAKVLGPADYEQYQLRNSYTARNMRDNLSGFQPSEDEFKQIFQARKSFDDQYAFNRDGDAAAAQEKKAAQQKMEEQLKAVLGPDRFHDYQLSQDERFRDTFDFTQRYNLPRETADTVYQVRVAAEQEKQRIQGDPSLTAEARTAALTGLSQDTRVALGQTLGPDVMANYLPRSGGWLNQMSQGNNGDRRGRGDRGGDRGRRPGR